MPRSTFTELLRPLDPFTVYKDADPSNGTYIAPGMVTMLNIESTIDDWGFRGLHVRLLQRMLALMKALKATGQTLNAEEYTYLIRCADAASDIATAKWLWRDMDRSETTFWRQTGLYGEYVQSAARTSSAPSARGLSIRLRKFRFALNRLMHAVVESYCSNCEIALAVQIVDKISSRYQIPIPPAVWRNLLEWAHIASSPPMSTAWKKADMPSKVPASTAVEMLRGTMTDPLYNIRPTLKAYGILMKNLLGRGQFERARPYLREARRLCDAQCHKFEDSVFEYIQTLRGGADATRALHRHERARFAKQAAWYSMQTWCRRLLLAWRPLPPRTSGTRGDAGLQGLGQRFSHERGVPASMREFRDFAPNPAPCRTPSGYVRLTDPAAPFARPVFVRHMPPDVPMLARLLWHRNGEVAHILITREKLRILR
ncbi:hypothetical protein DL765_002464 [Monosporascus sp. GIB2]|nr:hypothetical protein DL765_002464 [Monosporascus sp. GIB2]